MTPDEAREPTTLIRARLLEAVGEDYPILGLLVDFEAAIRDEARAAVQERETALRAGLELVRDWQDFDSALGISTLLEEVHAALSATTPDREYGTLRDRCVHKPLCMTLAEHDEHIARATTPDEGRTDG